MKKVYFISAIIFICILFTFSFNLKENFLDITIKNIEGLAQVEYDEDHDPHLHGHLVDTDEKCECFVDGGTRKGYWYNCKWHPSDPSCARRCVTAIYP